MLRNYKPGHCRWSGDGSHVEVLASPRHWVRVRSDSKCRLTCSCTMYGEHPEEYSEECAHLRHAAEFLETTPCRYSVGQRLAEATHDDPYRIAARRSLAANATKG